MAAEGAPGGFVPPGEFDDFEVIRPLGRGGMGAVYLGRDTMLDRPVALKFIASANPDPRSRERFRTEARAIARLQHANVVGVYRIGEVQGRPYLAYEFIDGTDLHALPKPVPWPTVVSIAVGLARGLAAAHRRGVLHRDLKPANLMLTASGDVKLLDFGLAKLVDGEAEAAPGGPPRAPSGGGLTSVGSLAGTPLYMAPELWRGEPGTAQSDLYALGLVLHELLVGQLPHARLSGNALIQAILDLDLPPVTAARPDVPAALADVVARLTQRSAAARFATADDARDALEAVQAYYQPFAEIAGTRAGAGPSDDAARVAASFGRVAQASSDALARRFYETLFERAPALRPLFPADLEAQQQKLMGSLKLIVRHLDRPAELVPMLEDLGRRHAAYGTEAAHFEQVIGALIDTLAELDAPAWTPSLEHAWRFAYGRIAQTMVRALDDLRRGQAETIGTRAPTVFEVPAGPPRTQYARSGGVSIAYQVIGDGPIDLVAISGLVSHLEVRWQDRRNAAMVRTMASFARVILYDKRGTGLSDRVTDALSIDDHLGDLRAVLDAAGSERPVVFGISGGGALAMLHGATYPERTRGVALYGASARRRGAPDYVDGLAPDAIERTLELVRASWGEALFIENESPSLAGDPEFRAWWATYLRMSASPSAIPTLLRLASELDVREVVPLVAPPALVMHRRGDRAAPIAQGRWLAERLPRGRWVELDGDDHTPLAGDQAAILGELERFVHQPPPPPTPAIERLGCVLVGRAREVGLGVIERFAREAATRRGLVVEAAPTGALMAVFESPTVAIDCAAALAPGTGLGWLVHAGRVIVVGSDLYGPAIDEAAELAYDVGPGEIAVTGLVRELVAGGRHRLEPRPDGLAAVVTRARDGSGER